MVENGIGFKAVMLGHFLMIICGLFYLVWWVVTFRPGGVRETVDTAHFLLFAALSGLSGLIIILFGLSTQTNHTRLFSSWTIIGFGVLFYILLYFLTVYILKRQATTELLLIIGWGMLEFAVVNWMYGAEFIQNKIPVILFVGILLIMIGSLLCYAEYYRLGAMAGYIAGMIPLILITIWMTGILVILLVRVFKIFKIN